MTKYTDTFEAKHCISPSTLSSQLACMMTGLFHAALFCQSMEGESQLIKDYGQLLKVMTD